MTTPNTPTPPTPAPAQPPTPAPKAKPEFHKGQTVKAHGNTYKVKSVEKDALVVVDQKTFRTTRLTLDEPE